MRGRVAGRLWSRRRTLGRGLISCALAASAVAVVAAPAKADCGGISFERARYTVCGFDTAAVDIAIHWRMRNERPFATLPAAARALKERGEKVLMTMNAGMYHDDLSPVGYHVEDRRKLKAANTRRGPGNFHMLPNGIFFVDKGRAGVMETRAFLKRNKRPDFATQSGPMLVIDGKLHPRFRKSSQSRKSRNGVGVARDGRTIWFVLSDQPVTFHAFATLFQKRLKAANALFLDGGSVPQMLTPGISKLSFAPVGPIVAVTARKKTPAVEGAQASTPARRSRSD